MIEPIISNNLLTIEPVQASIGAQRWTRRLVLFFRVMAGISMLKGLYHWLALTGIGVSGQPFEAQSVEWQAATVFFAVIDLVAGVCLWLGAAWGAVIWLLAAGSMLAVAVFFPDVFGYVFLTGLVEGGFLVIYLWLALKAAAEQPL